MNISCNWLKNYIDFNYSTSELDKVLTMLGIEVENSQDLKKKYTGFFIGEVISKEKHPKSEILSLCKVKIGDEELQIVCGAKNVDSKQKVVVGKIGAIVPSNNMMLERRKIRDVYSEGMICSQSELELGNDSSGIWVLPNDAKSGLTLIEYLKMDDVILEISLTPNKSDCASHIGIAREIAAVLRKPIKPINSSIPKKNIKAVKNLNDFITVEVKNAELCPRYAARVIQNVKNGESPEWLQKELTNIGLRPLNIVVDVTNYILMDLGQPLHSFDLDKIAAQKLVIKNGFTNTKFKTLDDKERILDSEMLMICDNEKPVAIAGIMGGQNSEISNETTNVVLESAFFNPSSIRKTAKKLGISTDASYRFERGADIDMVIPAINKAAKMIAELTGGKVLEGIEEVYQNKIIEKQINFRCEQAKKIIGMKISTEEIKDIFVHLGFEIVKDKNKSTIEKKTKNEFTVKIPNRRVDIFDEIDLIEEVARIINYDNIKSNFSSEINFEHDELPSYLLQNPLISPIRNYFASNGFNEILTQNIIDPNSAYLSNEKPITIENPLGEEMSKMRPSIIPSMLKTISFNIRQGNQNIKLFECGKVFIPQNNIANSFIEGIDERDQLILALTGNEAPRQWGIIERKFDFFDIKGYVQALFAHLKINKYKIKPINREENMKGEIALFDSNSAIIYVDKQQVGLIGSINKNILQNYEIDVPVFVTVIDLTKLNEIKIPEHYYNNMRLNYCAVSNFPVMKRDLAFIIDEKYLANEIIKTITEKANNLLKSVDVFDVYQGKNIEQNKRSIGFELTFSSNERTLTDKEVETQIEIIINAVEKNYFAELRKN